MRVYWAILQPWLTFSTYRPPYDYETPGRRLCRTRTSSSAPVPGRCSCRLRLSTARSWSGILAVFPEATPLGLRWRCPHGCKYTYMDRPPPPVSSTNSPFVFPGQVEVQRSDELWRRWPAEPVVENEPQPPSAADDEPSPAASATTNAHASSAVSSPGPATTAYAAAATAPPPAPDGHKCVRIVQQ